MKRALLLALLVISVSTVYATVRNVSNSPTAPVNTPFTYNSLQTAVDSAADGDSLYVHGTNIDYGVITITNKTVTLIGAGYGNNLSSNFQQKTYISRIQFAGFTGTKDVVLVGLYLPSNPSVVNSSGGAVNNLLIDRCAMYRLVANCNNLIMRQSILEEGCDGNSIFAPTVNGNALIQNCVLSGVISNSSTNTSVWDHNIFKGADCVPPSVGTYNGTATFTNNIFNNGYGINVSNCTFNNNLFVSVASPLGSGNTGTGNIFSTSANFVNNAGASNTIGKDNYCTAVDYHLATGSAAIGAGTGGTDLGIYGGVNALPATAVLNGVPAMPRITEMNVQNLSVSPTGNLNVQIKAVKEN